MLKERLKSKLIFIAVIILIMALALSILTFAGCKSNNPKAASGISESSGTIAEVSESSSETNKNASAEITGKTSDEQIQDPIEVTDGMGNKITLEKPARRIIVFSPSILEIFEGLNAMDTVAEIDTWSVQNNEPLAKGYKGAGDANGINFETVAKINPDLVIVVGSNYASDSSNEFTKLSDLGYKIYMSSSTSLEGTYTEIKNIGKIIGKAEEGKILSENLRKQVEEIYGKIKNLPEKNNPKVFYMVWSDPIMSAGKNTFVNELIEKAGGINIVAEDGLADWPEYSIERLISNNPDIIIAPISMAADPDVILKDTKFATINAVINKRVYSIPDNPISRPNQNVIKGLTMMSMAIHPEIFGEFELIE
ncbi:MAG: ABC transporter substrate-binding protein [Actinomycetota bacterium]|nr:ABC transporter substrate-binding protein [Actinomycetota bacterium]